MIFDLVADMSNYGRWLPNSSAFGGTVDVTLYPVRLLIAHGGFLSMEFGRDLMLRRGKGATKGSSARSGIGRQPVASVGSASAT